MNTREKIVSKLKLVFKSPRLIVIKLLQLYPWISSDKFFVKIFYRERMGYSLNLENPQTYNEKLNWLKLNYKNPLMTSLVDKYEAKKYVSEKIGEEYIIPTYGIWNSFDKIDFDILPDQFVLKTTHDGGGIVVCEDKSTFNFTKAKQKLNKHLSLNHYDYAREWPYKDVKPRILAEKFMMDSEVQELRDYKFFCFNGETKFMSLYLNRQSHEPTRRTFYNLEFEPYDFYQVRLPHLINEKISKPKGFDKMVELANILSTGFPHVRVDFYYVNNHIYFGELTFYHASGTSRFKPEEWDYKIGEWITLPGEENFK